MAKFLVASDFHGSVINEIENSNHASSVIETCKETAAANGYELIVSSYLNKNGFALRAGLHCAPVAHKKIGTLNFGAVRFSPSVFNNTNEVDLLIKNLKNFKN